MSGFSLFAFSCRLRLHARSRTTPRFRARLVLPRREGSFLDCQECVHQCFVSFSLGPPSSRPSLDGAALVCRAMVHGLAVRLVVKLCPATEGGKCIRNMVCVGTNTPPWQYKTEATSRSAVRERTARRMPWRKTNKEKPDTFTTPTVNPPCVAAEANADLALVPLREPLADRQAQRRRKRRARNPASKTKRLNNGDS